ncbi:DUF3311 domain-containing protein [Actinoplanes sp. NPDC049118]|uniref:DUF3311 domain-containing protein n=1 Tax=Actinoplanes sp. NPDC049118 TaxID=3155769 RepID=UPI0033FDC320
MSTPRTDRSPWNWLLLIPIVVPLLTPLYNFDSPRLFGFPAFYWIQLSFILVGVATTSIVYQMTRRPPDPAPVPPPPAPSTSESSDE